MVHRRCVVSVIIKIVLQELMELDISRLPELAWGLDVFSDVRWRPIPRSMGCGLASNDDGDCFFGQRWFDVDLLGLVFPGLLRLCWVWSALTVCEPEVFAPRRGWDA